MEVPHWRESGGTKNRVIFSALAFFDPLFCDAAFVTEAHSRRAHRVEVSDDEPDTGKQWALFYPLRSDKRNGSISKDGGRRVSR
jgi:hypothetical protein